MTAEPPVRERALRALTGLALGDTLGTPTQSMSLAQIHRCYGEITGLRDTVAEQPIAPLVPAGGVIDDTEQALILAGLLINGGDRINPHQLADVLLRWEDGMCTRGSLDLLGPSTKLALERVRAEAGPYCTGRGGTINGATMQVAPVGIAFSLGADGDALTRAVQASCLVTHDAQQGFETTGLLATAINATIDGINTAGVLEATLGFVAAHPEVGHRAEKASVAARTRLALETSRDLHGGALTEHLRTYVGTSVESAESVPYTLVIVREFAQRSLDGLCFAAEFGGDADTITTIAGTILRANAPHPLPIELVDRVLERSGLRLEPVCSTLLTLHGGGHCQRDAPKQRRS